MQGKMSRIMYENRQFTRRIKAISFTTLDLIIKAI